jgi:hypothetical protein
VKEGEYGYCFEETGSALSEAFNKRADSLQIGERL